MNDAVSTLEQKLDNYSQMQTLLDQFKATSQTHLESANTLKSENALLKSQHTQMSEKLISMAEQIDSLNSALENEKDDRLKIETD